MLVAARPRGYSSLAKDREPGRAQMLAHTRSGLVRFTLLDRAQNGAVFLGNFDI